ncbi:MAG TPA: energy-coupling factor transporter transmembrane component T [Bacillota bacterium]|nr:energy-coupling factor transporter transmembrane component T [Bacillota bacterium]HPT86616.1 energy-coupling factor transporter transmembrane component T [Bacillota bacterium]
MSIVANYLNRDSLVHRLNPLTKLLWSLWVMGLSFLFGDLWVLTGLFFSVVGVALIARMLREMLPVFKGIFFFALFFWVFQVFFISEGQPLLTLIPGNPGLRITDRGIFIATAMGFRLMVIASSFPVLLATTQVKDMVVVLVEKLKIPYNYAFMFITSLRFIPTFMNEMEQIIQAQCSRAHRLDSRNFVTRFFSICPLAIPLMITSVKKAEQMAISMETRGFGIGKRTYLHRHDFSRTDWLVSIGLVLLAFSVVIMNQMGILN